MTPDTTAATPSTMLLDHPGWLATPGGCVRRAFRSGDVRWTINGKPTNATFELIADIPHLHHVGDVRPAADWFDPRILPPLFHRSSEHLFNSRIHRIRNPDLWDALVVPILRQRRGALDAKNLYRTLCEVYGDGISTANGRTLLPPRPETVMELPTEAFRTIKLHDKATSLRNAATAYLDRFEHWSKLSADSLYAAMLTVPGIGPWTAASAIADVTNDYSFLCAEWTNAYEITRHLSDMTSYPVDDAELTRTCRMLDAEQISTLWALLLNKRSQTALRETQEVTR